MRALQVIHVSKGENRTKEFLAISPSGKVPAYVEGDFVLTESGAIINYLLKKFKCEDRLLPPPSAVRERAKYEQWLLFTVGHLDPTLVPALNHVHHTPRENQDSTWAQGPLVFLWPRDPVFVSPRSRRLHFPHSLLTYPCV